MLLLRISIFTSALLFGSPSHLVKHLGNPKGVRKSPEEVVELLRSVDRSTRDVQSVTYQASWKPEGIGVGPRFEGRVSLALDTAAENQAWYLLVDGEFSESGEPPRKIWASKNSEGCFLIDDSRKFYCAEPSDASGAAASLLARLKGAWLPEFLTDTPFVDEMEAHLSRHEGSKSVAGVPCEVVFVEYSANLDSSPTRWYFGAIDHLPRRVERLSRKNQADGHQTLTISNLQTGGGVDNGAYTLERPDGYTDARDILREVDQAVRDVTNVSYHASWSPEGAGFDDLLQFEGRVHLATKGPSESAIWKIRLDGELSDSRVTSKKISIASDGQNISAIDHSNELFREGHMGSAGVAQIERLSGAWLREFLVDTPFDHEIDAPIVLYEGQQSVKDVLCDVLFVEYTDAPDSSRTRWYLGVDDKLPRRVERLTRKGQENGAMVLVISSLNTDTALPDTTFQLRRPEDYESEEFPPYCVDILEGQERVEIIRTPYSSSSGKSASFAASRRIPDSPDSLSSRIRNTLTIPWFGDFLLDLSRADANERGDLWRDLEKQTPNIYSSLKPLLDQLLDDGSFGTTEYGKVDRSDDGFYCEINGTRAEVASLLFFEPHRKTLCDVSDSKSAIARVKRAERRLTSYPDWPFLERPYADVTLLGDSRSSTTPRPSSTARIAYTVSVNWWPDFTSDLTVQDRFDYDGVPICLYYSLTDRWKYFHGVDYYFGIQTQDGTFVALLMVTEFRCSKDNPLQIVRENQGSLKYHAENR